MEEKVIKDKNDIPWLELRYGRSEEKPAPCPVCEGDYWETTDFSGWWIFPHGMSDEHPVCERCSSFFAPMLVDVVNFLCFTGKYKDERLEQHEREQEAKKHVIEVHRVDEKLKNTETLACPICGNEHQLSPHVNYCVHKVDGEKPLPLCIRCAINLYPTEHDAAKNLDRALNPKVSESEECPF